LKLLTRIYVLDANAILDYLDDGPGAATMERLLRDVSRNDAALMVSVINLGEVFYRLWSSKGEQEARRSIDDLAMLPVQFVGVDLALVLRAGELKARHKIPYVDSIAAALALERQATLVTGDRDFEKLGRNFPVLWLSRR
jgi:predicted nucleic acid-binding protein